MSAPIPIRPEPPAVLTSDDYADLFNAEALVARHGHELRWTPGWGWLYWDGTRWRRDRLGRVDECAELTVRQMHLVAAGIADMAASRKLTDHIRRSLSHRGLLALVERATKQVAVKCEESVFDRDPFLLNVANGTLDLRTGVLHSHTPTDYLTRLAPVAYDPRARAPTWDRFLLDIFGGDVPLITFLQRSAGYSLTASQSEQVMFLLHGTGSNGKSTFLQTLAAVLGDYSATARSDTLTVRAHADNVGSDIAGLVGARLVLATESEEGARINESLIKQMTGGELLRVRELYHGYFELRPTWKIWFATNHKPTVRGTDHAIWRRLMLIPFLQRFAKPGDPIRPGDLQADLHLKERLAAEHAGILRWVVEGCLAWQREGLQPPATVVAATAEYQSEQDVIGQWLDEACHHGADVEDTPVPVIYNAWCDWARGAGEKEQSKRWLSQHLTERGFETRRKGHGGTWFWVGISVRG